MRFNNAAGVTSMFDYAVMSTPVSCQRDKTVRVLTR